jgi:hypothetical protein
VYNLLSMILYPKRVHFVSLMLSHLSTGGRIAHAPEQGHNHNLDSVALNYPCPVGQLRVVRHNKTKCRENEIREQNYCLSIMPMQVYNTSLGSRMGTGPPCGGLPWGPPSMFFLLMVGAPGSPALTPPRGPPSTCVTLMVGALGSPAAARGPVVDVF